MSFLFVDKILSMDAEQKVVGIKHVTANDKYLAKDRLGKLILMPSIIGETLGQLGAWYVMQACGFEKRPVAGVVPSVTILGNA